MKVGLAFWGITRSLKFSIASIQKNILNVLKNNNIDYDIFMHTYNLNGYANIRTNEFLQNVDNDEYKLLNANYIRIDSQDEIKSKINLKMYRTHKDPWNTSYNSVDNFILAQYSKSQLVEMIKESNQTYDYIIYLRPDVLYLNELSIGFIKLASNNCICIPDFHLFGNFNDRFAITNMNTYHLYGDVFRYLLSISKTQPLHSETVLGKLMNKHKLIIKRIPFRFRRIRCDGKIAPSDKSVTPINLQPKKGNPSPVKVVNIRKYGALNVHRQGAFNFKWK